MEEEIWLPVIGFEGKYEVSSLGRLKRLSFDKPGKNKHGDFIRVVKEVVNNGRFSRQRNKYVCSLYRDGEQFIFSMPELVAKHFIPNPEGLPFVLHRDGDVKNQKKENLYWSAKKPHYWKRVVEEFKRPTVISPEKTSFGRGEQHLPETYRLKELLRYDEKTGILFWKDLEKERQSFVGWSKRFAGKPAGSLHKSGYFRIKIDGYVYLSHRVIYKLHHGWCPEYVDHLNRDRSDNRIDNLRPATKKQNSNNLSLSERNTSGTSNVSWYKDRQKWGISFRVDGKQKFFGLFEDLGTATKEADRIRLELGRSF